MPLMGKGNTTGKRRRHDEESTSSTINYDREMGERAKRSRSAESRAEKVSSVMSISSIIHNPVDDDLKSPSIKRSSEDDLTTLGKDALAELDATSECLLLLERIWPLISESSSKGRGWEDMIMILLQDWDMPLSIRNSVLLVLAELELRKVRIRSNGDGKALHLSTVTILFSSLGSSTLLIVASNFVGAHCAFFFNIAEFTKTRISSTIAHYATTICTYSI